LTGTTPAAATIAGGEVLALLGDFSAAFDPGTLEVFVSKVQGTKDEAVDYPADLQGYTTTPIDALAPARPDQGTFDLYASALDGGTTRVYSNPVAITYGPLVTAYDLDGTGNREAVETSAESALYSRDATAPPADAQMNQYTTAPGDTNAREYDENGNLLATDVAVFRHDYLDRI